MHGSGAAAVFAPSDISGLVGWYVADDLVTSSNLTEGNAVALWGDRSGNGNTLTNPVSTKRPFVHLSQYNGKHSVAFDGTDDFLNRTSPTGYSGESGQTIVTACQFQQGVPNAFANIV